MKKKQFIAGLILNFVSILSCTPALVIYILLQSGYYEGWEGLGGAILFALAIILVIGVTLVMSAISIGLFASARRSYSSGIRIASTVFLILDILLAIGSLAVGINMIINGL